MESHEILYYGLSAFLLITVSFIIKRYWKDLTSSGEEDTFEEVKSYGDSAFKNRDYRAALGFYFRCKALARNDHQIIVACNSIAKCFIKQFKFSDALMYLDRSTSLDIYNNHEALRMKSDCLSYTNKKRESYLELSLLKHVSKDSSLSNEIQKRKKEAVKAETDKYVEEKVLPPDNIKYSQLLDTLVGFISMNKECEIVRLIQEKNYKLLDDFLCSKEERKKQLNDDEKILVNITDSLLFYYKGYYHHIWETLANTSSDTERLFYTYFDLKIVGVEEDINYLSILNNPNLVQSDNPTVIFYLAKCNLLLGKKEKYFELLSKIKEYPFVYLELLDYYKNNETDKFEDISEEAINKFPGDMNILTSIAGELKEVERYEDLKSLINKMDISDPRTSYYKSEIAEYFNDTISREEYLRRACQLDSTLFIAYFTLVCIEVNKIEDKEYNPNDYKEIRKSSCEAISKAGDYRLVYRCQTALLDLDMTDYIHTKIREVPRK